MSFMYLIVQYYWICNVNQNDTDDRFILKNKDMISKETS